MKRWSTRDDGRRGSAAAYRAGVESGEFVSAADRELQG